MPAPTPKVLKPTSNIKVLVRSAYDIQMLRIQMGNRIVGNFKAKLGQLPSTSEESLDDTAKKLLAQIRGLGPVLADHVANLGDEDMDVEDPEEGEEEPGDAAPKADRKATKVAKLIDDLLASRYKAMTENRKRIPTKDQFKGDAVISSYAEFCLIAQYTELRKQEDSNFRRLEGVLDEFPIYSTFLKDVPGIGPKMAGVLISEIDITQAKYPSSLWLYAGLAVEKDGRGTSRRAEHLVDRNYTNKDGEAAVRKGIRFNPWLKTKLYILATSFLRCGENKYRDIYAGYKNRLENHPKWKDVSKGHRHNASLRYAVKQFLLDLYKVWRVLENLPVSAPYHEAKLGMIHGQGQGGA
jgi:hypothetical protein